MDLWAKVSNGIQRQLVYLLIALHDELMSSADKINIILIVELFNDVATEEITCTSGANTPTSDFIRVAPHQITHSTIVGYFLLSIDGSNFIKSAN